MALGGYVAASGPLNAKGLKIAMITSRFNHEITDKLLEGAQSALAGMGASPDDVHVFNVPGAFEIGALARKILDTGKFDALVCLGCVIRGETSHYDQVCQGVTDGVMAVANTGEIGVGFGVITVENETQAWARVGGEHGHKGKEAAEVAVEMARLMEKIT